jgi:hypothetical protein
VVLGCNSGQILPRLPAKLTEDGWVCHNLGLLYADQGKLDEAEKMYQRALQGKEKAWGPDHTSTLDTVNNLGLLEKALTRACYQSVIS